MRKILVIDDDAQVRKVISVILSKKGLHSHRIRKRPVGASHIGDQSGGSDHHRHSYAGKGRS